MGVNPHRNYPAKILLFGEYTVLHGGQALAIPYDKYSGHWFFLPKGEVPKYDLNPFLGYLKSCSFLSYFDLEAFAKELEEGLTFNSSIPTGYGAGSSGAFCAGVWDRFAIEVKSLENLRNIFIEMESFFHGKSSGLDPLVSYLNQPVLIKNNQIEVLASAAFPERMKVFDSGFSRNTEPLVSWYKKKFTEDENFQKQVLNTLLPLNERAIHAFLNNDIPRLDIVFKNISTWQFEYFLPLIPEATQAEWQSRNLKLCGAGGGGFYLEFD